jgi:hypothetical protein
MYAEDYDSPGSRAALERQLEAVSPDKPLPGWHALAPTFRLKSSDTGEQKQNRVELFNRKLDSITVPQIELQNAPLKEALLWLVDVSKKSDPNAGDPNKGVPIAIRFSKKDSASLAPVSVNLKNATVREALVKLIASNNLRVAVEPHAVVVHD